MGYTDVTVVWEGAVSDDMTFTDDRAQDMLKFLGIAKSDAEQSDDLVEIYTLHHDHELSDEECACSQYLTDHSPEWSNRR